MKTSIKIIISLAACMLCILLGIGMGSVSIGFSDMFAVMKRHIFGIPLPEHISTVTESILFSIRMPRAVMAFRSPVLT